MPEGKPKRGTWQKLAPAVWRIAYRPWGEDVAFIGVSSVPHDRLKEAIQSPKQGNWREYVSVGLFYISGEAEFSVSYLSDTHLSDDALKKRAIEETLQGGFQLINKEGWKSENLNNFLVRYQKYNSRIPDEAKRLRSMAFSEQAHVRAGSDAPASRSAMRSDWIRDPAVRSFVLERAAGKCEYCQEDGFLRYDGSLYLECHHIIALSRQGRDRVDNVIALCPRHHREAHFGEMRDEIEKKMILIVKNLSK